MPQVLPYDQILIVDDGGQDAKVVSQFSTCIDYIPVEHLGYRLASLQNLAVVRATHDFIVKLDGDCVPQDGWLTAYRKALRPGRLIAGRIDWQFSDGTVKPDWRFKDGTVSDKARWEGDQFMLPHRVWGGNFGFYRPDLLKLGGFSTDFDGAWGAEESDIGWRYHYAGYELLFLDKARVIHQYHPECPAKRLARRNRQLLAQKKRQYELGIFPPPLEIKR